MYQHWQTPPHERRHLFHVCGKPVERGDYFLGYAMQPQFWIDGQKMTVCPQCGYSLRTTDLHPHPYAYQITHARTKSEAEAVVTRLQAQGIPVAAVPHWLWGWTVNTTAPYLEQARAIWQGGQNANQ